MALTLPSQSFANVGQHPTRETAFELMIGFGRFRCPENSETFPLHFLTDVPSSQYRKHTYNLLLALQRILFVNREHTSGTRKKHLLESHTHSPALCTYLWGPRVGEA